MNTLNNPLAGLKKPAKPIMTREEFTSEAPMQIGSVEQVKKVEPKIIDLSELDKMLEESKKVEAPVKEKLKPETALLTEERIKKLQILANKLGIAKAHVHGIGIDLLFEKIILEGQ